MPHSNPEETAWTPDLIGPIYKKGSVSLREVLYAHRNNMHTRTMATFVPDELIYEKDLSKKGFRKFNAVLALFNLTRFFGVYEKYISAENGGSYALMLLLNNYLCSIIGEVYSTGGDVIKFSQDAMLVAWTIDRNEFISNSVYDVILCVQKIQRAVAAIKSNTPITKLDVVISAGEVTFSVIGDENARRFVTGGTPIDDLKYARKICLPGDLVLSSSAWEHCAPSQYEYVIKDSSNVKIIKVLVPPAELARPSVGSNEEDTQLERRSTVDVYSDMSLISDMSLDLDASAIQFQTRASVVDALRRGIGNLLETYILKPVLVQIAKEESLKYLTEVRQVTAICVSAIPFDYTVYELISMVDQLFKVVNNVAQRHSGCISMVNLFERDISFYVMFGVREYSGSGGGENYARNGILSASQIMREAKRIAGVKAVLIGVSTGTAFCGVVGHLVRRQYMIFGTPVDKAISLMMISFDKISCDYDTLFNSTLSKDKFRSRGMKQLRRFGKCHVYEFLQKHPQGEAFANLEYCYPILGRIHELEYFKDILDDIGVPGRIYCGLLIEGNERSGKSRLLDAFVTIVRNRQIRLVGLSLHPSQTDKAYAALYHMFLQLLDAKSCTTIEDRERVVLNTLSEILKPEDFCYLNTIMRVRFPLSQKYCEDIDWKRHKKTIEIFEVILNEVIGRVCILLDDVQYMDLLSWQFLSSAMNNHNVVLVMTMMEPVSWDNLTQVEAGICQDKRLMSRTLEGLDPQYLAAFACQFLNVIAIPKGLEKILQRRSKNMIGWCEAFLMSALQVQALQVTTISPKKAADHDLVFPDQALLLKIPVYLTPEELAPPLHWTQMSTLNVCIPFDKPRGFVESNRDVTGLRIDIYNRMNSYEQEFIKCAATLGRIFLRSMVDTVMPNSAPTYTSKAVAEMIRLRILECAMIQRKHCHLDDSVFYVLKKRRTFSNMHHLVTCDCQPTRIFLRKPLPSYAYCKVLEFTLPTYQKLFYEILTPHEKKDYHTKAVELYERDARRCNTCGEGEFLTLISREEGRITNSEMLHKLSHTMQRRGTIHAIRHDKMESRRSIFVVENDIDRKRESVNIRRISILPFQNDAESNDNSESPRSSKEGYTQRRASNGADSSTNDQWFEPFKQFSYVDYRNCRCMEVVSYLFWKLHYHITNSNNIDLLIKFMLEYGAGLIHTAQPLYATKFLAATAANINILKIRDKLVLDIPDAIVNKGRTLVLMGDAYVAYGNYAQAKKFYTEAVTLRAEIPHTSKAVCYTILMEQMRYKVRGLPEKSANGDTEEGSHWKTELAVYWHRLSMVSMLQNKTKMAKLAILHSLRAAFESNSSFLEKGNIYLTAVDIFRQITNFRMIYSLEKPMLKTIERKNNWKNPDEVIVVARVYEMMYMDRILTGRLNEGIEIGIKICKICNYLHLSKMKLNVLPSLIEILVWTKQVNEAVDLLYELYYLAKEDTDYSAITWYYALCMELLLDAAMILETYDTCFNFYDNVISFRSKTCVLRDPESLSRLTTCLVIWQLRMNIIVTDTFVKDVEEYTQSISCHKFSQIYNCIKGLESYLLILKRRINIRRSNDLFDRVQNANSIIKFLQQISHHTPFVKPFLYLLQTYMDLLRGRKIAAQGNIVKANKAATSQGNKMVVAWVEQNKRTWEEGNYNNMAHYWVEHVGNGDGVRWQEIHSFGESAWSTIMFPLPIPSSNF